jgi:hypothetical protein
MQRQISQNYTKSQIILENCIIVKHKDICRVVRLILNKAHAFILQRIYVLSSTIFLLKQIYII